MQSYSLSRGLRSLLRTPDKLSRTVSRRRRRPGNRTIDALELLEDRTLLAAPVAQDDSFSVAAGSTLNANPGVLQNDTDPDGDPLNAVLYSSPTAGSLSLNADGTFQYTPSSGFSGNDTFTYFANDGVSNSNLATVTIAVTGGGGGGNSGGGGGGGGNSGGGGGGGNSGGGGGGSVPTAFDDDYVVGLDSLSVAASGILANDIDPNGDPLTAALVSSVSNGSLTFNADGAFTYTPAAGFTGNDSFTYFATDGTNNSNTVTVSLEVKKPFTAQTNLADEPSGGVVARGPFSTSWQTGDVFAAAEVGSAHSLLYRTNANSVAPIIGVETTYEDPTGTGAVPSQVEAKLTFGGITVSPVFYSGSSLQQEPNARFAVQVDASSLPTGRYAWEMEIVSHYSTGVSTQTYAGSHNLLNRSGSEFGAGANVTAVDQLVSTSGGMLLVSGSGTMAWFEANPGPGQQQPYFSPSGPYATANLTSPGIGFELHSKYGDKSTFDSNGLLTDRVDPNGNTVSYIYIDADGDGSADELSQITDPYGRVTSFNYTAGLLSSTVDPAGRVTTITHDANSRVASVISPDPDGTGPLTSPTISYGYNLDGHLDSITDPIGAVTQLQYDFAGRLESSVDALGNTWNFEAIQTESVADVASGEGTSSNPFVSSAYGQSGWGDPSGNQTEYKVDRFGNLTEYTNFLGAVTSYERDADGRVTKVTTPDPDGSGPQSAAITTTTYDGLGNVTMMTLADGSTITTTVDSSTNLPSQIVDTLGGITTITRDSAGNPVSIADALGRTYTVVYDSRGDITTLTAPDPDGSGPLSSPATSISYDSYGRVTTITNPDGTTHQFTWDSADNLLSATDELGRVTATTYDALNRPVTKTGPDPDGAGPLAAPVVTFAYDVNGRMTSLTDPIGNSTSYTYDLLGRRLSTTEPDPDGAGPLAAPVTSATYDASGRRTSVTDPLGNTITFQYDTAGGGKQTSFTLPDPDGSGPESAPTVSFTYDSVGRTTTVTDSLGGQTSYEYDVMDRTTAITDALGNVASTTYDAGGRAVSTTDPLSNTVSYAYDNADNLISTTFPDPDGAGPLTASSVSHNYDDLGRMTSSTDPRGFVTSHSYDIMSRPTSTTDALGGVYSASYDAAGRVTGTTDALGNVTSYVYDDANNLLSTTQPDPDGAGPLAAPVRTYAYDTIGRMTSATDALGNVTSYAWDALSRVVSVTDAMSNSTTLAHDASGNRTSVTDGLGNVTQYAYDNLGRMTAVTDALAGVTGYEYNKAGQVTAVTDPNGNATTYGYDAVQRMVSVTDAAGKSQSYVYDASGNVTSVTDRNGDVTSYGYDDASRLVSTTDATGNITSSVYDASGNQTSVTNALGNTTQRAYDALNRSISMTDAASGVTTVAYNLLGSPTTLTDSVGNTTTFVYDNLQRLTSETNQLNKSRSYGYDAEGNLTSRTDRNGRTIEYVYDALSQLTQERWLGSGSGVVNTVDLTYDSVGLLTNISDSSSAYAYSYDALGRLTSVDNFGTPDTPNVVLNYSYDAGGRRTSANATIDGTADFSNGFSYDTLNRLTRVEQSGQAGGSAVTEKRVDLSYTDRGQFASIERYEDLAGTESVAGTTYAYDGAGRLTSLDHDQGSTSLASYSWTYDAGGRLTQTSSVDGTATFAYDATDQLVGATHSSQTNESYSYDANGNRTNSGYQTGSNNQLLSDGTFDYQYDDEGNRTKKTDIATGDYVDYTWDHLNRMTAVDFHTSSGTKTKSVSYTYDALNRRIGKQVDETGNGVFDRATRFVFDSSGKPDRATGVALDDVVLVFEDNDGDGQNAATLDSRLLHGPATDQVFATESVLGEVLWSLADHQGTVRDWIDYDSSTDNTSVVNHIRYDSFGNIAGIEDGSGQTVALAAGLATLHYGYTGRVWDEDVGLYYYRNRWFDPTAGRFISEDPLGFAAGDTNISRYVGNNAPNALDPSGLYQVEEVYDPGSPPGDYGGGTPYTGEFEEPSWWDEYSHYLLNPSEMDDGIREVQYAALVSAGTSVALLAVLVAPPVFSFTGEFAAAEFATLTLPTFSFAEVALIGGGTETVLVATTSSVVITNAAAMEATAAAALILKMSGYFEKMGGGNNKHYNKQIDRVERELSLTKNQRRQLHDEITGQGYTFEEIMEIARAMFGKW